MKLPSFEERLGLICQNVIKYKDHGQIDSEILAAANKLSVLLPPILVEDSFKSEILEVDKPLSKTFLWTLQKEYFDKRNIQAWEESTILCNQ